MDHTSIEAWLFESIKRSRLGQMRSFGSNRIKRFQMVYTNGASAIGVPGCPDLACCTASIERVRIVFIRALRGAAAPSPTTSTSVTICSVMLHLAMQVACHKEIPCAFPVACADERERRPFSGRSILAGSGQ